jgi:hypothetical protein
MTREIVTPIDIAHPDGRLRREAVGWARHPILGCALPSELGRVVRWNYWCISNRECALTLLVADVGVAGTALVSFVDFAGGAPVEHAVVKRRLSLPDTPRGQVVVEGWRLRLAMRDAGEELHIEGEARALLGGRVTFDLTVSRPRAHETINVLVPWDETRFHFTSKQQALPARGTVVVAGREHRFGPENQSFACLDFGRGRRPSQIEWRWAFGSVSCGGRTIGINLGARWTDGTGVNENGVVLDGRVHKIAEDVDFQIGRGAWHIRSARIDLRFRPLRERTVKLPLGVVSLQQRMGVFDGSFTDDGGARVTIENMPGLAESVRGRWWI